MKTGKFCLTVQYNKNTAKPEDIFTGIARIIEGLRALDVPLMECIDSNIVPNMMLEDVEKGSIKIFLSNLLNRIPDECISNLEYKKIIGQFLVDGKYLLLDKLGERDKVVDAAAVGQIEDDILELAERTGANQLNCYSKPSREKLLDGFKKMSDAYECFDEGTTLSIENSKGQILTLNTNFRITSQEIENLTTVKELVSVLDLILKVRKPDLLGETAWVFKHGADTINAKINDEVWLNRYLSGSEPILPGDSLHVQLKTINAYDNQQNLLRTHHSVEKVIEVVHREKGEPINLISD